jgi:glycosyltransferase involved in cell wall biosynthesis
MVKVSVLMAVYNEEAHLREAVDSVLAQSFEDYEIIIIDDASTDGTRKISEEYAGKYDNVKVLRHNENKYRAAALNYGLTVAEGEFVAFLDGDDIYTGDKLKDQVRFMNENKDVDLVYSDMERFYPDGKREVIKSLEIVRDLRDVLRDAQKREDLGEVKPYELLLEGREKQLIPGANVMLRKKVFDSVKYDENMITAQDYDLWFQIIGAGFKLAHLHGLHYSYRMHKDQTTKNQNFKVKCMKIVNEKLRRGVYFK